MIELAVLGALMESELHGYELKKRLREVLGPLSTVSFGSLYPALRRLEDDGAVRAVDAGEEPISAIPMTGSLKGEAAAFRAARRKATRGPRNKKVYGITDLGRRELCRRIADPSDDDKVFPVKLAFCGWCDRATRLDLLQRRRGALAERLRERGDAATRTDRYLRSLVEHDTESIRRDIAWLDRLIAEEAADDDGEPLTPSTNRSPSRRDDRLEGTST